MPDSQSYQLMYTGEQVDDALGKIISGEINQSAQNSAISSYASRVWAEGEQASYNPVSFGQIEAHGVKVAYDGTEDISIVPGATYKVTSGSDEVSVIAAVNPSATKYGTFTAFGIVFDSNTANYINATNSTDTTITVSTQRQPSGFSGTSSKQYAQQAGQRANSAAQSASAAEQYNANAQSAAQQAESWAVGGTGTRDGEDTNNAKYWCEQAQEANTAAEAAKSGAEQAAQNAQEAALHTPYVGDNGNWFIWDAEQGQFIDTGRSATALVDVNSGESIQMWFGTLEEYNSLTEIHENIYYNILEGVAP